MKKLIIIASSFIFLYCIYGAKPGNIEQSSLATPFSIEAAPDHKTTAHIATFTINCDMDIQKTMVRLFDAAYDESIHALALYINHPGGECGSHSALHDLIKAITRKKPVIAFITGQAYSCGYMMASASDHIICASGAGVGAIGTIWTIHKYSDITTLDDGQQVKDTVEVLTAGKYKAIENPLTAPLNNQTRKHLQAIVDENYQYFIKLVAENRSLSLETSEHWAEGREFMAEKALTLGLIDQIGTLFDVEQKALELLKIRKPDIDWAPYANFIKYETKKANKN